MSAPQTPFYPMTHEDALALIAAVGDESKLAQAYDSTRTYTKDEHCIYSGKLYKCISTISTAEAWTAAHWEEATVGDELTEHKKDIDAICQTVTGANNNTGHTINSGEYFIANGAKYKANAAIPNGEPWASSADPVSDNDLINALNSKITEHDYEIVPLYSTTLGTAKTISSKPYKRILFIFGDYANYNTNNAIPFTKEVAANATSITIGGFYKGDGTYVTSGTWDFRAIALA